MARFGVLCYRRIAMIALGEMDGNHEVCVHRSAVTMDCADSEPDEDRGGSTDRYSRRNGLLPTGVSCLPASREAFDDPLRAITAKRLNTLSSLKGTEILSYTPLWMGKTLSLPTWFATPLF